MLGKIKHKYAKGNIASLILERLQNSQTTGRVVNDAMTGSAFEAEIDCLLLMDRSVDLISPFCVQ